MLRVCRVFSCDRLGSNWAEKWRSVSPWSTEKKEVTVIKGTGARTLRSTFAFDNVFTARLPPPRRTQPRPAWPPVESEFSTPTAPRYKSRNLTQCQLSSPPAPSSPHRSPLPHPLPPFHPPRRLLAPHSNAKDVYCEQVVSVSKRGVRRYE